MDDFFLSRNSSSEISELRNTVTSIDLNSQEAFRKVRADYVTLLYKFKVVLDSIECSNMANRSMLQQVKETKSLHKEDQKKFDILDTKYAALNAGITMCSQILDTQSIELQQQRKAIEILQDRMSEITQICTYRIGKITNVIHGLDDRLDALELKYKKRKFGKIHTFGIYFRRLSKMSIA